MRKLPVASCRNCASACRSELESRNRLLERDNHQQRAEKLPPSRWRPSRRENTGWWRLQVYSGSMPGVCVTVTSMASARVAARERLQNQGAYRPLIALHYEAL